MPGYIGVNDTAQKIKNLYIGVNGIAKRVKRIYYGLNNIARLVWSKALSLVVTAAKMFNVTHSTHKYAACSWVGDYVIITPFGDGSSKINSCYNVKDQTITEKSHFDIFRSAASFHVGDYCVIAYKLGTTIKADDCINVFAYSSDLVVTSTTDVSGWTNKISASNTSERGYVATWSRAIDEDGVTQSESLYAWTLNQNLVSSVLLQNVKLPHPGRYTYYYDRRVVCTSEITLIPGETESYRTKLYCYRGTARTTLYFQSPANEFQVNGAANDCFAILTNNSCTSAFDNNGVVIDNIAQPQGGIMAAPCSSPDYAFFVSGTPTAGIQYYDQNLVQRTQASLYNNDRFYAGYHVDQNVFVHGSLLSASENETYPDVMIYYFS